LFVLAKAQKEAYERKEKEKAKQAKTQVRNLASVDISSNNIVSFSAIMIVFPKFGGRIIFRVLTI